MTERILGADLLSVPLDHAPLPADEVLSGTPTTGTAPLGELGAVQVGLWEMSEGVARDTEADEIFVVLAGAGRVAFADGHTIELAPGTAVRLRAGERTTWTVTETLRKVYVAA